MRVKKKFVNMKFLKIVIEAEEPDLIRYHKSNICMGALIKKMIENEIIKQDTLISEEDLPHIKDYIVGIIKNIYHLQFYFDSRYGRVAEWLKFEEDKRKNTIDNIEVTLSIVDESGIVRPSYDSHRRIFYIPLSNATANEILYARDPLYNIF